MRGRTPAGPELALTLQGSEQARERFRVILEVAAGRCRVAQACRKLALSPSRLEQLRRRAWQAAVEALEPRPGGRPPSKTQPGGDRVAQLEARVRELEHELALSQAREEIAGLHGRPATAEKKTRQGGGRRRRSAATRPGPTANQATT